MRATGEERAEFVAAVVAIIVRGDRCLAMRRAPSKDAGAGIWETCSGRIRPDEQPEMAIRREIDEETGLDVDLEPTPIDAYTMRRGFRPMLVVVYRGEWRSGEVRQSEEHDQHAWWNVDELRASAMPARLKAVALRVLLGQTTS